mmetsp:Transcript_103036/g.332416  ORF Transcript_103036/g.332416 Transcript_103036/m.332416 type:complete len:261 (-) Transcript_103036:1043-1825(-)
MRPPSKLAGLPRPPPVAGGAAAARCADMGLPAPAQVRAVGDAPALAVAGGNQAPAAARAPAGAAGAVLQTGLLQSQAATRLRGKAAARPSRPDVVGLGRAEANPVWHTPLPTQAPAAAVVGAIHAAAVALAGVPCYRITADRLYVALVGLPPSVASLSLASTRAHISRGAPWQHKLPAVGVALAVVPKAGHTLAQRGAPAAALVLQAVHADAGGALQLLQHLLPLLWVVSAHACAAAFSWLRHDVDHVQRQPALLGRRAH